MRAWRLGLRDTFPAPRACWHSTFAADFASEGGRCKAKIRAYAIHRRVFLTRQMPSYGVKAAKMLIANTPFGLLASRALAKQNATLRQTYF